MTSTLANMVKILLVLMARFAFRYQFFSLSFRLLYSSIIDRDYVSWLRPVIICVKHISLLPFLFSLSWLSQILLSRIDDQLFHLFLMKE